MNRLARVVDPEVLAARDGTSAKMRVHVPVDWAGSEIEVDVPSRVGCATCDQGGCDRCGRSGAFRVGPTSRVLRLHLPATLGEGVAVRVFDPFEDATDALGLLIVEVVTSDAASACRRIAPPLESRSLEPHAVPGRSTWSPVWVAAVVLAVSMLAIALGHR